MTMKMLRKLKQRYMTTLKTSKHLQRAMNVASQLTILEDHLVENRIISMITEDYRLDRILERLLNYKTTFTMKTRNKIQRTYKALKRER
jgi:hypothetical protein